jgi:NAD-dependent dihydropyrimidine dehydrogenase PreA subunit
MTRMRYLTNVSTLAYDADKCLGCRMCTQVCPHEVFVMENKKARLVDRDACMECGACAMNCAAEAITVNAGVGCATGIILGSLKSAEPCCG